MSIQGRHSNIESQNPCVRESDERVLTRRCVARLVKADLHIHAELLAERTKVVRIALLSCQQVLLIGVALLLGWLGHLYIREGVHTHMGIK